MTSTSMTPSCLFWGPRGPSKYRKIKKILQFYSHGFFFNVARQQPQKDSLSLPLSWFSRIWRCVTQVVPSFFQANTLNLSNGKHQRRKKLSRSSNYVFLTVQTQTRRNRSQPSAGAHLSLNSFGFSGCMLASIQQLPIPKQSL